MAAAQHVDHADVGEGGDEQRADAVDDLRDRARGVRDLGRAAQQPEALPVVGESPARARGARPRTPRRRPRRPAARSSRRCRSCRCSRRSAPRATTANAATAAVWRAPANIAVRNGAITTVAAMFVLLPRRVEVGEGEDEDDADERRRRLRGAVSPVRAADRAWSGAPRRGRRGRRRAAPRAARARRRSARPPREASSTSRRPGGVDERHLAQVEHDAAAPPRARRRAPREPVDGREVDLAAGHDDDGVAGAATRDRELRGAPRRDLLTCGGRYNRGVPVHINHAIVAASDKLASARTFTDLFGLAEPEEAGPFAVVRLDGGAQPRRPWRVLPRSLGQLLRGHHPPLRGLRPPAALLERRVAVVELVERRAVDVG